MYCHKFLTLYESFRVKLKFKTQNKFKAKEVSLSVSRHTNMAISWQTVVLNKNLYTLDWLFSDKMKIPYIKDFPRLKIKVS